MKSLKKINFLIVISLVVLVIGTTVLGTTEKKAKEVQDTALKVGIIVMAPDVDPVKHRASIKTSKIEITTVLVELMNFDQAVKVCKDLVQTEGVQSFILCPGFTHEAVAKIVNAVGKGVAVTVARGDGPSTMIMGQILATKGWFPKRH